MSLSIIPQTLTPETNKSLFKARKRVSKTTYKVVNKKSGCYGVAERPTPDSRSDITIHHNIGCRCSELGLKQIAEHIIIMFRQKRIRRARRDDLIMAVKLGLPDVGIRVPLPGTKKLVNPDEVDEKPVSVIEQMPGGQLLVEMWDTPEAWRERRIWKDW
ncbi:hypothetical protein ABKA04_002162 [Annulohypoxylon sp. FPYF3050]